MMPMLLTSMVQTSLPMQLKLDVAEVAELAVEGAVTTVSATILTRDKTFRVIWHSRIIKTTMVLTMAVHICGAINDRMMVVLVVAHSGKITEVAELVVEVLTSEHALIHLLSVWSLRS